MQIQKSCLKVTDRVSNRVSDLPRYGRESEVLTVCDELRLNLEPPTTTTPFPRIFFCLSFFIHFYVYMQTYAHIKRMYLLVIWRGKKTQKQTKHPHWSTCSTSFWRKLSIIEAFYICWLKHLVSCLCSRNSWERLTPTHTWCAAVKLKRVRAKERKQSVLEDCFLFIHQGHRNAQALGSQCVDNKMGNVG